MGRLTPVFLAIAYIKDILGAMNRYGIYLPDQLLAKLRALSRESGFSVSELIRMAIVALLEKYAK